MNRTIRYRARHLQRGRKKAGGRRVAAAGKEDRALLRLVICAAVFVLLVAVKLLFPQSVSTLARSAGQLLGRDADFKEAFAAVGRAISGEEDAVDSLQDAYTAVFGPEEIPVEEEKGGISFTTVDEALAPATRLLKYVAEPIPVPEAADENAQEDPGQGTADGGTGQETRSAAVEAPAAEQADAIVTDSMSYVYTMPPLPENASLEQRNLGFACTTPVFGAMTSPFGWREHPIEGEDKFHYGLDLAADTGTAICAFADGVVYATGESSTLGKYIMLEHAGGYITLYAHCDQVTVTGGSVAMGQKIAEVGETGAATGPHLHFELHDGKLYLNPIYYVEVG